MASPLSLFLVLVQVLHSGTSFAEDALEGRPLGDSACSLLERCYDQMSLFRAGPQPVRDLMAQNLLAKFDGSLARSNPKAREKEVGAALAQLQKKLVEMQGPEGQWEGVNEGEPRWDALFALLAGKARKADPSLLSDRDYAAFKKGFGDRVAAWPGVTEGGLAKAPTGKPDPSLNALVGLALKESRLLDTDPRFAKLRQALESKRNADAFSSLDRANLEGVGYTKVSAISVRPGPSVLAWRKNAAGMSIPDLGFVGAIAIPRLVSAYYRSTASGGSGVRGLSEERRRGNGDQIGRGDPSGNMTEDDWAQEGLAWVLAHRESDGNPGPMIFTTEALLAAHEARAGDFSAEIRENIGKILSYWRENRQGKKVLAPTSSSVWDTARVIAAVEAIPEEFRLQELDLRGERMNKAVDFLLRQESPTGGYLQSRMFGARRGGWGFTRGSQAFPDADDTSAVVDALQVAHRAGRADLKPAMQRGVDWMSRNQERDGSFGVWVRGTSRSYDLANKAGLTPMFFPMTSNSDVTSRVTRTLVGQSRAGLAKSLDFPIKQACASLRSSGAYDGCAGLPIWSGVWAVNKIYGTTESVLAQLDANCMALAEAQGYAQWMAALQDRVTGGWGEALDSVRGEKLKLGSVNAFQTGVALFFLLEYEDNRMRSPDRDRLWSARDNIEAGVSYLLAKLRKQGDLMDRGSFAGCFACGQLYVNYELAPHYVGTQVLGKYQSLLKSYASAGAGR